MKNKEFDQLLESLDFDVLEAPQNHRERFIEKLHPKKPRTIFISWRPFLMVAASLLVAFLVVQQLRQPQVKKQELAQVSSEMKTTQDFYATVITRELDKLKKKESPATKKLITDALKQLNILETDYEKLKIDLVKSGQDQRVIYAMIFNFQKRIDLLNHVLEKVKTINSIKTISHEDNLL